SGTRSINVPGYGSFDVLIDDSTVGPGWIVIQQRIDGKEEFFRDFSAYSAGFGSFEGDFFLGLEKIHQLTNSWRYELAIHMEDFIGNVNFALFDNFKVGSQLEDYKLKSLGEFSSNGIVDQLRFLVGHKFSTYNHNNADWSANSFHYGGWWFHEYINW
ncbi:hypothetical protein KR044_009060, partial [Drosophila immigrans]